VRVVIFYIHPEKSIAVMTATGFSGWVSPVWRIRFSVIRFPKFFRTNLPFTYI
jgi:hypothetical protein